MPFRSLIMVLSRGIEPRLRPYDGRRLPLILQEQLVNAVGFEPTVSLRFRIKSPVPSAISAAHVHNWCSNVESNHGSLLTTEEVYH
jgi:hypothetical protein